MAVSKLILIAAILFTGLLTLSASVRAAPSPDDMLYGCVANPHYQICSDDFLKSMTADMKSRNMLSPDETLSKGSFEGKETIVIQSIDGKTRAIPMQPPAPYRQNP